MILIETPDGRQLVHSLDGCGEENHDYMLVAVDVPEPPSDHCDWDHTNLCWTECPVRSAAADRLARARRLASDPAALADYLDALEARVAALEAVVQP